MSCCPDIWYCTPDGPEAVSPDEDGLYTPPEGWTGGPFASITDAIETDDCGCAFTVGCGEGQLVTMPDSVLITADGYAGDCAEDDATERRYFLRPFSPLDPSLFGATLYGPDWEEIALSQYIIRLGCNFFHLTIGCDDEAPDPAKPFYALLTDSFCNAFIESWTPVSPWTSDGGNYSMLRFSQAEWESGILFGPVAEIESSGTSNGGTTVGCNALDGTYTVTFAP